MLAQAQASGQKAQEDARRGQGSIFDLGDDAGGAEAPAGGASRPRASAAAGRRVRPRELLRLEKETLGIFLSSHPLGEVGHLLRAGRLLAAAVGGRPTAPG